MKINSGLLLAARDFYQVFSEGFTGEGEFLFQGEKIQSVLKFLFFIGVMESREGKIQKTNLAEGKHNFFSLVQYFMLLYAKETNKLWVKLADKGRQHSLNCLKQDDVDDRDTFNCLKQADLTEGLTEASLEWWSKLALYARDLKEENKGEIGRKGELLSFNFESQRIGKEPKRTYIEDNTAGYDILSWVSRESEERLSIEVKTSTRSKENRSYGPRIFLSRNEWKQFNQIHYYQLHIWDIFNQRNPLLAVLNKGDIHDHIPQNRGQGRRKDIEISLDPFFDKFKAPSQYLS